MSKLWAVLFWLSFMIVMGAALLALWVMYMIWS